MKSTIAFLSVALTAALTAPATFASEVATPDEQDASAAKPASSFVSPNETVYNIGIGPNVPSSDPAFDISNKHFVQYPGGAPSASDPGEVFDLQFADAKTKKSAPQMIDGIRLIAFSKTGEGKMQVRVASGAPNTSQVAAALQPLTKTISDGESVSVKFPKPISVTQLALDLQAVGDKNTSVALQLITSSNQPMAFAPSRQLATSLIPKPAPVTHSISQSSSAPSASSSSSSEQYVPNNGQSIEAYDRELRHDPGVPAVVNKVNWDAMHPGQLPKSFSDPAKEKEYLEHH
jgi:hypothetical protein